MNNINFFDPGLVYSFKHGCVFPGDTQQNKFRQLPICIFDDTKNRAVIKNDIKIRLNSLFPNKSSWGDTLPIRRILFLEFYRQ